VVAVRDLLQQVVSFDGLGELLPIARQSILAGVLLGVIAGVVGPMIHARDLAFAVHGTSELSFAGAACALFLGHNIVGGGLVGSLLAASVFGLMGVRAKERNSVIGIVLPFGLGLGVLFLALYRGRSSNKFGLLAGQIVAVDNSQLLALTAVAVTVLAILLPIWRPLFFASVDEQVAVARGVPVRTLSLVFMVVLGLAVAMTVQLVGALLVMAMLITPSAAAARVTARPPMLTLLSVLFGVFAMAAGIVLSLAPGLPISPYVTTISFLVYLVCRAIGALRSRRGWSRRTVPAT
jgi:zinc/manganese transport system permease protein